MLDFYEEIAEKVGVSSDTIRKWFSVSNNIMPSDIDMVKVLARELMEDDVTSLLITISSEDGNMEEQKYSVRRYKDAYKREFAITLTNVFREDFPMYFAYGEGEI